MNVDLRNYSDDKLIFETEKLVRSERELLTHILNHLREIERRRLFSKYRCSSLFDYAVKKLGYSEDQAARRIASMRFLKGLPIEVQPEVEKKILSGALTLSHLSMAQSFVHREALVSREGRRSREGRAFQDGAAFLDGAISHADSISKSPPKNNTSISQELKLELLKQIESKPKREAEKIVLGLASHSGIFLKDRVRPVTQELSEVKFHADDELLKKIEKLKGLLAHKHPSISMAELFHKLCDLGIEKWDLGIKKQNQKRDLDKEKAAIESPHPQNVSELLSSPAPARVTTRQEPMREEVRGEEVRSTDVRCRDVRCEDVRCDKVKIESAPVKTRPKPLSKAALYRAVWQKAKSQCENCKSTYALQIDHITPKSFGGLDTFKNLRLLCRPCNQRAAIAHIGLRKMNTFFERGGL